MNTQTLLCIDDRLQLLEHRKTMLEAHGFSVTIGSTAHAAMKILEKTPVDAVVLEYKLEGMDAEAVAYQINRRFPNLPIVLLSAHFQMPERILWLVDEYVMKSELPGELVRVLKRVTRPANTDEALTVLQNSLH